MKLIFSVSVIAVLLLLQAFAEASSANSVPSSTLASMDAGDAASLRAKHRPQIKINCSSACSKRCKKASRKKRCTRACKSCCMRCHCVPPGTYGNKNACPCYARLKTHGNKLKCP
ncbi:gibberellin-regulated protein 9-like [Juglans microcarpa x Juglans regia]|uniref:gibberellin-regulated protein 9-like n=1 Tax=Juglans microcarpa x Juglans regia TaxID=2249226 RepID=UPI001B7EEBDB|nr:gibberellin-regulated protein 9-like [Juglans microcarpa x Juglans regia]